MTTNNNTSSTTRAIPVKQRKYIADWPEVAEEFMHLATAAEAAAWATKQETTAHALLADSDLDAVWGHVTRTGAVHRWTAPVNTRACREPDRCPVRGCKPGATVGVDRHLAGDPADWAPTWESDSADRDSADVDDPATVAWVAALWKREPA